ncbi:hypothetical protein MVEG_03369 [Podila verticillata NRRL 6337]|nr:hypothetical protein MVEG_03369 [Podila verticillata NRRL 6337]
MASLFGFGSNGNGQLGIGSDEDTSVPKRVKCIQDILDITHPASTRDASIPFHCFAAGGNHTALITQGSRRLFMTGSNKDAESLLPEPSQVFRSHELTLGSGPLSLPPAQQQNQSPTRWCSVACGWAFTVAVTEPESKSGTGQRIYAWGSGAFGELGLGPGTTKTGPRAMPIAGGVFDVEEGSDRSFEIVKVAAGLRHVLALVKEHLPGSDQHEPVVRTFLVGWGSNRQGQLGQLIRNRVKGTPGTVPVPFTEKELRGKIMEPTRIQLSRDNSEIVDMTCGQNHSLVLFSDGSVYSSGLHKYGQLGPSTLAQEENSKDFRLGFERVVGLPYVDSISCGWNHNAAMDSRVEALAEQGGSIIYMWGRNDHGQLGNGVPCHVVDGVTSSIPSGIVSLRIPNTGESRQGHGNSRRQSAKIASYSCGSEHTLAMTGAGECFAWGWNEHGNCGAGAEDQGQEKPKDVPAPRKVLLDVDSPRPGWVQGGYGSSWVLA